MTNTLTRPILLITGKSGVGKDTIADFLCKSYGYTKVKSYTTRPPRYEGEDTHIFVSRSAFNELSNRVAYTNRNGVEYCATAAQANNSDIYIIDPPGIEYFLEQYRSRRKIIIIEVTCPESQRIGRVLNRSTKGAKELQDRNKLEEDATVGIMSKLEQYVTGANQAENGLPDVSYHKVWNRDDNLLSTVRNIMSFVRSKTFEPSLTRKQRSPYKVVYVSHPYQNKPENKEDIERYIQLWTKVYKGTLFISPVHCFGFMYDKVGYDEGLDWCLHLLTMCDEMWVCGDYENSTGCKAEIEFCKEHYIPWTLKQRGTATLD